MRTAGRPRISNPAPAPDEPTAAIPSFLVPVRGIALTGFPGDDLVPLGTSSPRRGEIVRRARRLFTRPYLAPRS
jgi:hypothetical protein